MGFPERLAEARKAQGLNQKTLAERIGVHLSQVQRYEAGTAQPTLEVIRRMALALSVSADYLIFEEGERGPKEDALRLMLEAVDAFTPEEKSVVREVLAALIITYQSRRWDRGRMMERGYWACRAELKCQDQDASPSKSVISNCASHPGNF